MPVANASPSTIPTRSGRFRSAGSMRWISTRRRSPGSSASPDGAGRRPSSRSPAPRAASCGTSATQSPGRSTSRWRGTASRSSSDRTTPTRSHPVTTPGSSATTTGTPSSSRAARCRRPVRGARRTDARDDPVHRYRRLHGDGGSDGRCRPGDAPRSTTTPGCGHCSTAIAAGRSARPAMASSRGSTGRPGPSAAPATWSPASTTSGRAPGGPARARWARRRQRPGRRRPRRRPGRGARWPGRGTRVADDP